MAANGEVIAGRTGELMLLVLPLAMKRD